MFSAVNSAFLIVTMGGLSSAPMDETNLLLRQILAAAYNHSSGAQPPVGEATFTPTTAIVRQNCVFFASLSVVSWLLLVPFSRNSGSQTTNGRDRQDHHARIRTRRGWDHTRTGTGMEMGPPREDEDRRGRGRHHHARTKTRTATPPPREDGDGDEDGDEDGDGTTTRG